MQEYFRKIHEYNYWANKAVLKALTEMNPPEPKGLKLLGHIIFAMDVWLARVKQEDLARFTDPWIPYTLDECRGKVEKLHQGWIEFLEGLKPEDLPRKVSYTNTKGQRYECAIQDVIIHVVDHGTYHRGQMATAIHQGGGKGASTGFYGFVLEKG